MIQYIYFVKCPHCEDEPFDFFDEAKAFAAECIASKPIITQTEVERNDFGECIGSTDLGTIWSWEEIMGPDNGVEPEITFNKADLESDVDAEFDALDNSVEVQDILTPDCPTCASTLTDENSPTIDQLVEMMEENEDIVECKWCDELFDKSECRYEVDLGWLCDRCQQAIKSRGESLTFREGSIDGSLEESMGLADYVVELEYDELTANVVKRVIPATLEDPEDYEEGEFTGPYTYQVDAEKVAEVLLSNFMSEDDFADLPGGKADLDDSDTYEKFFNEHLDDLLVKYNEQLLKHFEEDAAEEANNSEKFQAAYADTLEAAEDDYWDRRYEEERDRRRFGDDD